MRPSVGIVDYQMGNLRSVQKALERVGADAIIGGNPHELAHVSHLVLPGVGAFGDAIAELKRRDLVGLLRDWTAADKPFLGICLGMQLLFDGSEEGGWHEGLSVLGGNVVRFQNPEDGPQIKIPHMGWNRVQSRIPHDPMLESIPSSPFVYFVHTYYAKPTSVEDIWLESDYGVRFCAAVRRGNVMATQFHPEKSQRDGLQLLANFLKVGTPALQPAS